MKPWGDVVASPWAWGRHKPFSPSSHWGCKHQVELLSSRVPPPLLVPASMTQSHLTFLAGTASHQLSAALTGSNAHK